MGDPGTWFSRELRIARLVAGLSQAEVAARVGISQARLSRIERGAVIPDLALAERLASAVGYRLVPKLIPDGGVRLRDSGQLELARAIQSEAHAIWRVTLEAPIGLSPDRRAGDILLASPMEVALIEIERSLADLQAQLRAAQLKRAALAERLDRVVRLIFAVPDRARSRAMIAPHVTLIRAALPVSSRRAWAAIRSGEPVGGDALMWVRPTQAERPRQARAGVANRPASGISRVGLHSCRSSR